MESNKSPDGPVSFRSTVESGIDRRKFLRAAGKTAAAFVAGAAGGAVLFGAAKIGENKANSTSTHSEKPTPVPTLTRPTR